MGWSKIIKVHRTVPVPTDGREGLCSETGNDIWMHEDVLEDGSVTDSNPVRLIVGTIGSGKTTAAIDVACKYLAEGRGVLWFADNHDTQEIIKAIRAKVDTGFSARLGMNSLTTLGDVFKAMVDGDFKVMIVDGVKAPIAYVEMLDFVARKIGVEVFITRVKIGQSTVVIEPFVP